MHVLCLVTDGCMWISTPLIFHEASRTHSNTLMVASISVTFLNSLSIFALTVCTASMGGVSLMLPRSFGDKLDNLFSVMSTSTEDGKSSVVYFCGPSGSGKSTMLIPAYPRHLLLDELASHVKVLYTTMRGVSLGMAVEFLFSECTNDDCVTRTLSHPLLSLSTVVLSIGMAMVLSIMQTGAYWTVLMKLVGI